MTRRIGPAAHRGSRAGRAVTVTMAVGVGLAGVTGCSTDSRGPEAGEVTVEDLQGLEDQIADLRDRVAGLDERVGALTDGNGPGAEPDEPGAAGSGAAADPFFADGGAYVGQQVTVSAEVSELLSTSDVGGAFRIAVGGSEPVAVVSATPPPQLHRGDVVRVTGAVMEVRRDSFEQDFGVAAGELFADPDAWFEAADGEIALSADEIDVLDVRSDG